MELVVKDADHCADNYAEKKCVPVVTWLYKKIEAVKTQLAQRWVSSHKSESESDGE